MTTTRVRLIDDDISKYAFTVANPGGGTQRGFIAITMGLELNIVMTEEQFGFLVEAIKNFTDKELARR